MPNDKLVNADPGAEFAGQIGRTLRAKGRNQPGWPGIDGSA